MILAAVVTVIAVSGCGTSIHDAAGAGEFANVQAKVEANPKAIEARDKLGKTPIYFAITYKRPEIVDYLIQRGADVNTRDNTGLTPLHVASLMSRPECAELLIKAGAHIDATDDFGDTPLHTAAMHDLTGMIGFLVRRGADLNAKNNRGETPMDIAVRYGQQRAIEKLRGLLES